MRSLKAEDRQTDSIEMIIAESEKEKKKLWSPLPSLSHCQASLRS